MGTGGVMHKSKDCDVIGCLDCRLAQELKEIKAAPKMTTEKLDLIEKIKAIRKLSKEDSPHSDLTMNQIKYIYDLDRGILKLISAIEIMKDALEFCSLGEQQFDGVASMHKAREALEKAKGILE